MEVGPIEYFECVGGVRWCDGVVEVRSTGVLCFCPGDMG